MTSSPGSRSNLSVGHARLTPLRELQLVELHRAGGPAAHEALSELIRGYQRRVFSICLRMVRNQEDAADLTQDSLLKVIEGLDSYGGQSKLSTWVIRVTMNCCLSHLRKQKIRTHESLDSLESDGGGSIKQGDRTSETRARGGTVGYSGLGGGSAAGKREPTPAESVEQTQTRSLVLQALEGLDADTRSILVLRDLQDLDYQQLAEVLEVPVGTVKSRLFRARASLRTAIEARGGV